MSRRQTLGAISPSAMNTRSGAPSRIAATSKDGNQGAGGALTGVATRSRKSMAPGAEKQGALLMQGGSQQGAGTQGGAMPGGIDPRRSSAFGGKPAGPKTDPRPVSDKNFLNNCVRTIITYLSTHGYTQPVAPKTLASPTAKEFTQIVQFLIQQFDPNMKTFGKIEDDVPLFFKRINYPFQISKSALFAVGSPHSWPAVLVALTWLVELLNYNEKVEEQGGAAAAGIAPGTMEDQDTATKRQFFEYICTSYRFFLAGDDQRCNAVDEEMLSQFTSKERTIAETQERIREANKSVLAELERLKSEPCPRLAAQQRVEEKKADTAKFSALLSNLENLKVGNQRKLQERQADLESKQAALLEVRKENDALRARIAAQPVNKADLNRMVMEKSKQKEVLELENSKAEELEQRVHAQEVQFVAAFKALDDVASRYNSLVHKLKLVPATSKRADGVQYELKLNREASTAGELANLDLKGIVRPGLDRLRELYGTKAEQLRQDLLSLKEAATACAEAYAERTEENAVLEEQIVRLEQQLKAAREAQEERVKGESGKAKAVEEEVAGLRVAASTKLAEVETRKKAALEEFEAYQKSCEAEIQRLRVDLRTALELMLEHKMYVNKRLEALKAEQQRIAQEVAAMPLPQSRVLAAKAAGTLTASC